MFHFRKPRGNSCVMRPLSSNGFVPGATIMNCFVPCRPPKAPRLKRAPMPREIMVRPIGTAKRGDAPPVFKDGEGRNLVFAQPSFQHF